VQTNKEHKDNNEHNRELAKERSYHKNNPNEWHLGENKPTLHRVGRNNNAASQEVERGIEVGRLVLAVSHGSPEFEAGCLEAKASK